MATGSVSSSLVLTSPLLFSDLMLLDGKIFFSHCLFTLLGVGMTQTIRNPWRYVASFYYLPELPRVFPLLDEVSMFPREFVQRGRAYLYLIFSLSKITLMIRTDAQGNQEQLSLISKKSFHLPFNYLFKTFKKNLVRKKLSNFSGTEA